MRPFNRLLSITPAKIAAIYIGVGLLLILIPDAVLQTVSLTEFEFMSLLLVKDVSFLGLSAGLIFGLTSLRERQLSDAQNRLQAANEQLRVIQRIFRHNLRNEMTVITGFVEMVRSEATDSTVREYLGKALRSSNRLIRLTNKLGLIDQITPERAAEHRIDLVELLEQDWEVLREISPETRFHTDLPERAPVKCDSSIAYAVRELIENAVTHHDKPPADQEIELKIERGEGTTTLQVIDNGPGIPEYEIDALRVGEETALYHGSGLGLWLVKWLAQMYGGKVSVERLDRGTRVSIHLESVGMMESAAQEVQTLVDEVVEDINRGVQGVQERPPNAEQEA